MDQVDGSSEWIRWMDQWMDRWIQGRRSGGMGGETHLKQKKSVSFGREVGFTFGFMRPVHHQGSETAETRVDLLCHKQQTEFHSLVNQSV